MSPPAIPHRGLRHLALNVKDVPTAVAFYTTLFGMHVVWQPDAENAYLSSGCDNLALHQVSPISQTSQTSRASQIPTDALQTEHNGQSLDHFGFVVEHSTDVDRAAEILTAEQVPIIAAPRTHRDGSRSLYCKDPDGNVIQILYEPNLSPQQIG